MYTLLDFGCGVGNGFYPVIEHFGISQLSVNACDISKKAISLIEQHPLYDQSRINAIKSDLENDEIPFEASSADFCLFLFVLSAITPEKYVSVV